MPLVRLIQVGELYFVSDGHHRISVARAFGQQEIEAQVTVWQVEGALPWEQSGAAIKRISAQVWRKGYAWQTRLALTLSDTLIKIGMKLKVRYQLKAAASTKNGQ